MTDHSSLPPTGGNIPTPPSPNPKDESADIPRGFRAKPMTFLGMHFSADEAGKLWQIMSQNINRAIEHDKKRAIETIRKFGKDQD